MALIESVIKLLLQKLGEQFIQEALSLRGARDQVEFLQAEFTRMQYFLKDADAKQEAGDERVKNWVREVRDVAYEAEDVIDTFTFDIATLRRKGSADCIRRYVSFFCELIALYKVSSEIKRINNRIRGISESRSAYGIQNLGQGAAETSSASQSLPQWRRTSPLVEEPDFVGFKTDLEVLVTRLTKGELRRCVVSVVGMGGLGKTTLTKKVYNDTRVQKHFPSCGWITVSQVYDVRDLLLNIIKCYNKQLREEDLKNMDLFQLRHEISQCLKERRYLIVLDDIWTLQAWDDLKVAFPDIENGSRVMLTTRQKDVALHADATSRPHELRFLNNEESWNLFCKKAFPRQDRTYPQDVEMLGREIVEKCHGLPLAIIVIGGLLSRKEAWEWENVHKTISWQFVEGQPQISKILSLSYRDLPYQLKPCFLYMGIFPEDCEFRANKLIRLWAAEGFLQQRENETVEEMGENCLKELIQRSMIQPAARKLNGGIKNCRIHDLLRDLSISEAKNNKFLQIHRENVDPLSKSTARRLAIYSDALNECTSLESYNPRLRSLLTCIGVGEKFRYRVVRETFLPRGFKLLRVLDLLHEGLKELPREIGELIHLRYLGCTYTKLESLPLWIGNLPDLQTLVVKAHVNRCGITIFRGMEKMQQLRHFKVKSFLYDSDEGGWGVIEGHPRLDLSSNLQTLSYVKAGEWMNGCLGKLTNLRKLAIRLDEQGAYADVLHESIVKMECLQTLTVTGYKFPSSFPFTRLLSLRKLRLIGPLDKLPDSPQFLTKLTYLSLKYSRLNQDPLATLEKLKNLRKLRLFDDSYVGKEVACSAQGFPRLNYLVLQKLTELEEWRVEEGAMPCLFHLGISDCQQLKKLPEGLQHVTTLKTLKLYSMPDEFKERLQKDGGEDWHKIRHVRSIEIRDKNIYLFR